VNRFVKYLFIVLFILAWVGPLSAQDATPVEEPTFFLTDVITLEPTVFVTDAPTLEPTQEATPTPEPVTNPVVPPDVLTPEDSGNLLLTAIFTAFAAFANGALTTTFVTVIKMFTNWDPVIWRNIIGAALTIIYWIMVRYGFGEMFESAGQFLLTAVPAFVQLYGTIVGSSALHRQSSKHEFPVLGYERPDPKGFKSAHVR
jgi:hypothetical protein